MNYKRVFDVITASAILIISLPFIAIIASIIRFFLGSPILFRQTRLGFQNNPFVIYKFRTMVVYKYNKKGELLCDEARLTNFGRWLRETSLDELPQLWNVLKGEMSLVGPRPLLIEHLACYATTYSHRHRVLPGITGWAQVNGRNALSLEQKLALDIWYVDHQTLWLDLKILLLTIKPVLLRSDV